MVVSALGAIPCCLCQVALLLRGVPLIVLSSHVAHIVTVGGMLANVRYEANESV